MNREEKAQVIEELVEKFNNHPISILRMHQG